MSYYQHLLVVYLVGALFTVKPTKDWREFVIMTLACVFWPLFWICLMFYWLKRGGHKS